MINLPVFPFKDPQAFYDNLVASQPDPNTHKPDPAKGAAFSRVTRIPRGRSKIIKSHAPSSGFDNSAYYSLNAFRFVNAAAHRPLCAGRWRRCSRLTLGMRPGRPKDDKNYLFDALIASIQQHPLQWHLIITVGAARRSDRQRHDPVAGRAGAGGCGNLTLDSVESEETSPARDINFDPLVLPAGMAPSERSFAQRSIGGLLAIVYQASRREERAERDHAFGGAKVSVRMTTNQQQFPWFHAVSSLADGRDGTDDARHWRCDGRVARRLSRPGIDPSPVGDPDPDSGGDPVREPALQHVASFSGHDVAAGALDCERVGNFAVHIAVCAAAGRLGDVVGGALSDCAVRIGCIFSPSFRTA